MSHHHLSWAVNALAQIQGLAIEPVRLQSAMQGVAELTGLEQAHALCRALDFVAIRELSQPDPALLPAIAILNYGEFGLVIDKQPNGLWLVQQATGQLLLPDAELSQLVYFEPPNPADKPDPNFASQLKAVIRLTF